ncbi:MAG: HEAT repeat domain-containing protein [Anaerolineae bacterium]|nr:HEAT repeat domain-containing protein [Anaerolineae bacterium]
MPDIVEYHIARLSDKNPEVRLKSVRELGLIGGDSALAALEAVFRTESDVAVKHAIQEAGRAIYRRHKENEAGSGV